MTARRVRVGDAFKLARRRVTIDATAEYREIGVRSFGNGIFHKDPLTGIELGNKRVFEIHPGDLIVSNVFAWEGAVAVASAGEAQMIGSHRFMTWVPDQAHVDVRFAYHYFTSARGISDLVRASPGSAGRNKTLGISAFENLEMPLPDLNEQRTIADRLDHLSRVAEKSQSNLDPLAVICDRYEAELAEEALSRSRVLLSTLATVNPQPTRDIPDNIHFVPMADLDGISGTITGTQLRTRADLKSGYKQFIAGDVLFARITPCMQNGKCAIFSGELSTVGYGSTEFHVLRAHSALVARPLQVLLRTQWFRSEAARHFTGTAGQQRVPAQFLRDAAVPNVQHSKNDALIEKLIEIDRMRRRGVELNHKRNDLATALPRAARNEVFSTL